MRVILVAGLPQQRQNAHYEIQLLVEQHNQRNPQYLGSSAMVDPYAESQMLAPDAYPYQDFWNYAGCVSASGRISRAVDATLDGVLRAQVEKRLDKRTPPPVGSQPPAAGTSRAGVEPAAPGVAAPAPAAAAGAQTCGAAPLTYAPDYAAAPPGGDAAGARGARRVMAGSSPATMRRAAPAPGRGRGVFRTCRRG